jgi:hypothetical protein
MVRLGLSLSLPASRKPIYGAADNHFRSVSDRTYTVKQKFDSWREWLDLALPEKFKPTILTSISGAVRRFLPAGAQTSSCREPSDFPPQSTHGRGW